MHDERFADDYPDDAQFYDGLEDHPGHRYPDLHLPRWLREMRDGADAAPPETPARLLTPEEFMRKYGLGK